MNRQELTTEQKTLCLGVIRIIWGESGKINNYSIDFSMDLLNAAESLLNALGEERKGILAAALISGKSAEEAGAEQNITGEDARKYWASGIRMLRHPSRAKQLEPFLTFA